MQCLYAVHQRILVAAAVQRCCCRVSRACCAESERDRLLHHPHAQGLHQHETTDITLLDYRTWLLFSDRVSRSNNAGVPYQVYTIYGDHESMLTQQANLATAILEAVAGLQG